MVVVIFIFDLKVRSKKVKKVKFQNSKFENKTHFSDSVSSQKSNGVICFVYDVYKWPKNVIYFYDVTTFHTYYSHLVVKN